MSYTKRYKNFLNSHQANGKEITHTRIGSKSLNIYGGSWHIPNNELSKFHKLYARHVLTNGNKEYLTERQIKNGNILIDIDFKQKNKIRVFDTETITNIIDSYLVAIENMFSIDKNGFEFYIFVLHRDNINDKPVKYEDNMVYKDGLHLIFNLRVDHTTQMLIRNEIMNDESIKELLHDDLKYLNKLEDIFDKCISTGNTNWQLYGSSKPGHEIYKLQQTYKITYDTDGELTSNLINVEWDNNILMELLSARSTAGIPIQLNEKYVKLKEQWVNKQNKSNYNNNNQYKGITVVSNIKSSNIINEAIELKTDINNIDELNVLIDELFNKYKSEGHSNKFKDIHDYTMALSDKYYGDYGNWLMIGWALFNSSIPSGLYFYTWVAFSSKWDQFDWDKNVQECLDKWISMSNWETKQNDTKSRYTYKSIEWNCKQDNPIAYNKIKSNNIDDLIEKCVKPRERRHIGTDVNLATLAHLLFNNDLICTRMTGTPSWLYFNNHHWNRCEKGVVLSQRIGKDMSDLFSKKVTNETNIMMEMISGFDMNTASEEEDKRTKYAQVAGDLQMRSKKVSVMAECAELFYDFEGKKQELMDSKPFLLCFNNGVFDIEANKLRPGIPEDYISLSTNIDYIEIDNNNKEHLRIVNEINNFMESVFPDPNLRKYMWEHAASSCIGRNTNQTFQIYKGNGCNGKSKFVDLLTTALGDYAGKLNISLLTQSRTKAGAAQPDFIHLKGKRYVSMDEPSKGDKLNDGLIKQITGGDLMPVRQLHSGVIEYIQARYDLVCCCNQLFEINCSSNDYGIWRRIRVCDFDTTFVDDPCTEPYKDNAGIIKHEHKIDRDLNINDWLEIFMSMVLKIAVKTKGITSQCDRVEAASNRYQQEQDCFARFISQKIRVWENDEVGNKDIKLKVDNVHENFNDWLSDEYPGVRIRKQIMVDYFDDCKKFKKAGIRKRNNEWIGLKYNNMDSDECSI